MNTMPNNNDPLYSTTWHYEVRGCDKVIYVGLTTHTLEEILKTTWGNSTLFS